MKKLIVFLSVIILPLYLSSCGLVASDEIVEEKYCEQFPTDNGCLSDGIPTGITVNDSESCSEGYIFQDDECVILNDDPINIVDCETGFHEENEQCVPDQVDTLCEENLFLNNGDCVASCELPIDNPNYFPCFRECNDEYPCTYHKLVLAEDNSYFEIFILWIQSTDMNDSTAFELHHVLKGETDIIVSQGGTKLWCNPLIEGCEELYKANYIITNTTGEFRYIFEFWYDENWYAKVNSIHYKVWNTETNDYDDIDLNIEFFYLEDVFSYDEE